MTTTLRSILRAHETDTPLVYLSDGGTTWFVETLIDSLDDESLDSEDYAVGEHGIVRLTDGYRETVPDYRYTPAWQSGDEGLTLTLDTLLEAAKQADALDSDMPTFGGDEPANTDGVWSWDATRLLVGANTAELRIVTRDAWANA